MPRPQEQPQGSQAAGEQPQGSQAAGEQPQGSQAAGEQPQGSQAEGEQAQGSQAEGEQAQGPQVATSHAAGSHASAAKHAPHSAISHAAGWQADMPHGLQQSKEEPHGPQGLQAPIPKGFPDGHTQPTDVNTIVKATAKADFLNFLNIFPPCFEVFSYRLMEWTVINTTNTVSLVFSKSGTIWNTGEKIIVNKSCINPENRQKHKKQDNRHKNPRKNGRSLRIATTGRQPSAGGYTANRQ